MLDAVGCDVQTCGLFRFSETEPPAPRQLPSSVTSNNISIFWTIDKQKNHCLLEAIITVCNYTATNGTGYESIDGASNVTIHTKNATIITITTIVADLSPFTSYVCSAFTIATEDSDRSDPVYATTLQDGKQTV